MSGDSRERLLVCAILVAGLAVLEGIAARADQAALVDRATAQRAAERIPAGSDLVLWTRLPGESVDTYPPVLYRAREVTLAEGPYGWTVRVLARRLAEVDDGAWRVATWGPAERLDLDLAYAYVPAVATATAAPAGATVTATPGAPGRFANLAAELSLSPEVASTEIAVPAAIRDALSPR